MEQPDFGKVQDLSKLLWFQHTERHGGGEGRWLSYDDLARSTVLNEEVALPARGQLRRTIRALTATPYPFGEAFTERLFWINRF